MRLTFEPGHHLTEEGDVLFEPFELAYQVPLPLEGTLLIGRETAGAEVDIR